MKKIDQKVHGNKGVWHCGQWVDIEDCADWCLPQNCPADKVATAASKRAAKRAKDGVYDVVIIGAGCVGSAIARELAKYQCSVLMLERDDDVTQGATKGNSGIVHAGYDDTPGSVKSKFCWPGNQMFPELDRDLRFGYLQNGSLVLAKGPKEEAVLQELLERGHKNGVKNLEIVDQKRLREMEPHVHPDATAALYSPDAGTVTPYEFAIALAENAADNGVDVRIRHEVVGIDKDGETGLFTVNTRNWDPKLGTKDSPSSMAYMIATTIAVSGLAVVIQQLRVEAKPTPVLLGAAGIAVVAFAGLLFLFWKSTQLGKSNPDVSESAVHPTLAFAVPAENKAKVESYKARFVVNCAGLFADKIANMVGDHSFKIKPRLGDYLLLHKNQGHLARQTLFPCPDPVLGKGVLVQTTLWGNLILGPTARDTYLKEKLEMSNQEVFEYILGKCRALVPDFDSGEVIHSFCGARAKSDRGDWIIEESKASKNFFHAAGIDSPGLAGSPAIAKEIVRLLHKSGLDLEPFDGFNPIRQPLIVPKNNWKSIDGKPLKVYKPENVGKVPADQHILCKCEKVTEQEIVNACRTSLVVDNTQAIRRRTRAGMGHCQAGEFPHCEQRVAEIIARERAIALEKVGRRPWPATSLFPQRWLTDDQKEYFRNVAK